MVVLLIICSLPISAVKEDLQFIISHNKPDSVVSAELPGFSFEEANELKIGAMGLIRLYQLFLSSQDMPACQFTPSCSRFTMAAIKKYGLFWGGLMGSDRLQRCHGFARWYYPIHPETDRCFDPPESEWLWAP